MSDKTAGFLPPGPGGPFSAPWSATRQSRQTCDLKMPVTRPASNCAAPCRDLECVVEIEAQARGARPRPPRQPSCYLSVLLGGFLVPAASRRSSVKTSSSSGRTPAPRAGRRPRQPRRERSSRSRGCALRGSSSPHYARGDSHDFGRHADEVGPTTASTKPNTYGPRPSNALSTPVLPSTIVSPLLIGSSGGSAKVCVVLARLAVIRRRAGPRCSSGHNRRYLSRRLTLRPSPPKWDVGRPTLLYLAHTERPLTPRALCGVGTLFPGRRG